jgi:SAM-dependent methyltransferase
MSGDKEAFLAAIQASVADGTFVRLTLGKFRGDGEPQKIAVTRVILKGAEYLKFVTSMSRNDATQNTTIVDGIARVGALAGQDFLSATLFTTAADLTLQFSKKKSTQLVRSKATCTAHPPAGHNRAKSYIVDPTRRYLHDLGISDAAGTIKPTMYAKFRQVCHFIDIVADLLRAFDAVDAEILTVADIGSGKGYLTFALYDYLTATLGRKANVTGIEVRPELVALCSDAAHKSSYTGLTFEAATAARAERTSLDILIALHACDTATDDAIFHGITANAGLIITAPCCQHELAPQLLGADKAMDGLMKFGLFKQRQADLVTDAARCLLLEASGYKVKVIEFVSTEHTAKNILIAGVRSSNVDRAKARDQYGALKTLTGFTTQHLEVLLNKSAGS